MEDKNDTQQIYTVTHIVRDVRSRLAQHFPTIWVKGELSNTVQAASGHFYFSLKDESAQIRCAMFRSQNSQLTFQPENGLEVLVKCKLEVYQQRGDLQLIIEKMEPAGLGELQLRFEQLKQQLLKEGLFEDACKKPIPSRPKTVGIITSSRGAALHDALTTLEQRFSPSEIIIYPATVQGRSAAEEICQMLRTANQHKEVEVLLLIRGGGSMEDLQAFNEEAVARAIASSKIPVVSGVGHEVDFTIADFVSDFRAPTPTAAAVKISLDRQMLLDALAVIEHRLEDALLDSMDDIFEALNTVEERFNSLHPSAIINSYAQQTDQLQLRIAASMRNMLHSKLQQFRLHRAEFIASNPLTRIEKAAYMLDILTERIPLAIGLCIRNNKQELMGYTKKIEAFSPFATLKRGYAIVTQRNGHIIRSSNNVVAGEIVEVKLDSGGFAATVEKLTD